MENTQTPSQKRVIIASIAVIVLAAISIASWFLWKTYQDGHKPDVKQQEKVAKEVTGTLLLSMLPKEIKGGMALTFSVEPKTGVFTPLFQYIKESDGVFIFHTSISPDHKTFVTGGIPVGGDPKNAENVAGLYKGIFDKTFIDIKGTGPVAVFGAQKGSKGKVLRLPSVNNQGAILYATAGPGIQDINFNWEIRYTDGSQDVKMANGLSPRWISDSQFVYLTSKGLRLHDVAKGSDSVINQIVDKKGAIVEMLPNMMMNVSDDGTQIALSNPEQYTIYLYKKEGERFVKNTEFAGFGFWPTFSPDGKILAVQTVRDLEKLKTDPSPMIEFWDIETKEPELIPKQIDLSGYLNDILFITDWY